MLLQNCSNHLQTDPFQLLGNLKKKNKKEMYDYFQYPGVEIKHTFKFVKAVSIYTNWKCLTF